MSAKPDDGGGAPSPRKAGRVAGQSTRPPPADTESETTGLPGLRTWRAVYIVVLGVFVIWVGLLTWLTGFYS